jgi:Fic family protein
MKTLKNFVATTPAIPTATVWLLSDLAEYRGKQELYTRQAPQRLKVLREHALIESAVSSNRIEGVEIDRKRVGTVVFGKGLLQDRNEEEVRGYQSALRWIHESQEAIALTPAILLRLHHLTRPNIWDSGRLKKDDGEIIEKHPDGSVSLRFKPMSAKETPEALQQLCTLSTHLLRDREVPPLIVWAAQNLDFLCIHPFRDGNGRVSRLLLLLMLYQLGFEAGRYISLERIIEINKERYYETLKISSDGWHEGHHNPWPYVNYLLYTLKEVYEEFARRVGDLNAQRGEKTANILHCIEQRSGPFTVADIQRACPGVGVDMIRRVLKQLKAKQQVQCLGMGRNAQWTKK